MSLVFILLIGKRQNSWMVRTIKGITGTRKDGKKFLKLVQHKTKEINKDRKQVLVLANYL